MTNISDIAKTEEKTWGTLATAIDLNFTEVENSIKNTTVENVLTSTSSTNALSAAQGKVLKDALDTLTARVAALENPTII